MRSGFASCETATVQHCVVTSPALLTLQVLPLSSDSDTPPSVATYTWSWSFGSKATACWSTWTCVATGLVGPPTVVHVSPPSVLRCSETWPARRTSSFVGSTATTVSQGAWNTAQGTGS